MCCKRFFFSFFCAIALSVIFYFAGGLLILEYLKVILTWPVMFFCTVLLVIFNFKDALKKWLTYLRIDYGGASFSSPQQLQPEEKEPITPQVVQAEPKSQPVQGLESKNESQLKELVSQWRANAYLWEYRYLQYYLVYNSQRVLDWIVELNKSIDADIADSYWRTIIPSKNERLAIKDALEQHYLIEIQDNMISATPKGIEYVQLRGKMPSPEELTKPTPTKTS